MSMMEKIRINAHYTRSVNLERDASSADVVRAYIPTSRALKTLNDVVNTMHNGVTPRSWALTGPYGSGKSSFAVYLSHLFEGTSSKLSQLALSILEGADGALAARVQEKLNTSEGYCSVLLTGSPEPMAKRLLKAMHLSALAYWANKRGRTPNAVQSIADALDAEDYSTTTIITCIRNLNSAIAKSGGCGLVIIIDEMGKFLEAEARNPKANDIYLLQAIAELACEAGDALIHFFVLLHQSFEMYANGLGETLKNEWKKVQGRFESVPFLESTEQTIRVISAAFEQKLSATEYLKVQEEAAYLVNKLIAVGALPSSWESNEATEVFMGCYPLHPVSLLLLPNLCQRIAQNERTLFSYLGSREPHGLHDSISRLSAIDDHCNWIYPWEIYEYFILNQPSLISDHILHRRWAEVVTAVERLDPSSEDEIHLIKTIGLMNIVGAKGGLKPSLDVLDSCVPFEREKLEQMLVELQNQSVITYRKYSGEFRVWQGSDFDLEAELQLEMNASKGVDLVEELNARSPIEAVIARRHTIETGTLRYFQPIFSDSKSFKKVVKTTDYPTLLILLASSQDEQDALSEMAASITDRLVISVVCTLAREIRDVVIEGLALERIRRNNSKLNGDPIAQRELRERKASVNILSNQLLGDIIGRPELHIWFSNEERLEVRGKRELQFLLSKVLDAVYSSAPIIKNELINRDKPSSSATSGRNKLLVAMQECSELPDLGIKKYPAEKAIYKSVLAAPQLHALRNGSWSFGAPDKSDPYRMLPMWKHMQKFYAKSESEALPLSMLFEGLQKPPFGIKEGVIPLLFLASYLANQHELALYEDGSFCPTLTQEIVERLIKVPHSFSVQRFRISGMRVSVYEKYVQMITGEKNLKNLDLIGLVKPLAKFMSGLTDYAKRTKSLSEEAQAVRRVFFSAKSPASLLFEDLPVACGFHKFESDHDVGDDAKAFSETFIGVLRELKDAYPTLLKTLHQRLSAAFPDSSADELARFRANLHGRFSGLERYSVDTDGVKAFVIRLCDEGFGTDHQWLESLAAFLGRKPAEKWGDEELQLAEFRLAEFSKKLHDLEKLRISYEENQLPASVNFEASFVRIIKQGERERERVIRSDEFMRKAYQGVAKEVKSALANLDADTRLALLADLLNTALGDNQAREQSMQDDRSPNKKNGAKS
ncbi:hypothetical protein FE236_02170 [Mariprofundus erugo]|uniref:hypothetical protein n=1 Tax=Mariprofundus erugo TaxID=2528639 RepID=UPI0010FD1AF6|nr:hypothetical protein [Mariprofundus erugo]TLS77928.1 hypothetical protein FE236_02170 [Mariprofundus erugo]